MANRNMIRPYAETPRPREGKSSALLRSVNDRRNSTGPGSGGEPLEDCRSRGRALAAGRGSLLTAAAAWRRTHRPSRLSGQEAPRWQDIHALERVEDEQVGVAGDEEVGLAAQGQG